MSQESRVEVVRIGAIRKHDGADSLSIVDVHGGYPCIIKTGDFREGDLAVYVPVDMVVKTSRPEFAFLAARAKLDGSCRIRAMKLRGVFSMGLLIQAKAGMREGQDVQEHYEIEKYLPPAEREIATDRTNKSRTSRKSETVRFDRLAVSLALFMCAGLVATIGLRFETAALALVIGAACHFAIIVNRKLSKKPSFPIYDLEGLRRYGEVFTPGEEVWISEKIHGCNAGFVHTGRRFFVRSRTTFRERGGADPGHGLSSDVWHLAAERHDLARKLRRYPWMVLFGEVYGEVQDLFYGVPPEERIRFAAFDVLDLRTGKYLSVDEFASFCVLIDVPTVPTLYVGPWSPDLVRLAEGKTVLGGGNVREGIVIKPLMERIAPGLGRAVLKMVGEGYLTRKEESNAVRELAANAESRRIEKAA